MFLGHPSAPDRKGITADGAPIRLEEPFPAPMSCHLIRGIEATAEQGMKFRFAGRQIQFNGSPGDLIIVQEGIPIVGDLLVRAVPTILSPGVFEERPSLARLLKIP